MTRTWGVGELDELISGDPRRIGPYQLEARLGSGGMGRVCLGRSPDGRHVAIKVNAFLGIWNPMAPRYQVVR